MEVFERGGYVIEYDAGASRDAYRAVSKGGADVCTCTSCKNFAAQRANVFAAEFLTVLELLGIDPVKEDEAWECGKDSTGLFMYGGWFHFVGRVVRTGQEIDVGGLRYWFSAPGSTPKPHDAFGAMPVAAIEFFTHLPWTIAEPQPSDPSSSNERPSLWSRLLGKTVRIIREMVHRRAAGQPKRRLKPK